MLLADLIPNSPDSWALAGILLFIFGSLVSALMFLIKSRRDDWRSWHAEDLKIMEKIAQVLADNTKAQQSLADSTAKLSETVVMLIQMIEGLKERIMECPCLLMEGLPADHPMKQAYLEEVKRQWQKTHPQSS